ncbi:MAG TPA: hypothetical protein VHE10_02610 [Candidatus Paceibacterota bacterium]|nr:hypothetical protein [Candidatus Paceibacterota bacterium]
MKNKLLKSIGIAILLASICGALLIIGVNWKYVAALLVVLIGIIGSSIMFHAASPGKKDKEKETGSEENLCALVGKTVRVDLIDGEVWEGRLVTDPDNGERFIVLEDARQDNDSDIVDRIALPSHHVEKIRTQDLDKVT